MFITNIAVTSMNINKTYLEILLKKELKKLNELIDAKVVMGLPYAREARQHKLVTARLIGIKRARHPWLSKLRALPTFFF